MKPLLLTLALLPTLALAQVSVQVNVPTPAIRFESQPATVEIQPGIHVVPHYGDEVFYTSGYWWLRTGGYWYRADSYNGNWLAMQPGWVPFPLTQIPVGQYRYYGGPPPPPPPPPATVYVAPPPPVYYAPPPVVVVRPDPWRRHYYAPPPAVIVTPPHHRHFYRSPAPAPAAPGRGYRAAPRAPGGYHPAVPGR